MISASSPKMTCALPGSLLVFEKVSHPIKLLDFLHDHFPDTSLRKLKKGIEHQGCKVNGKIEIIASRPLKPGDEVEFHFPESDIPLFTSDAILYEDNDLLAYNKQPGLTCEDKNFTPLMLIHRLDKDTSGILLLAKREGVRKAMIELFREKKVKKSYLAIVVGHPQKEKGKVENYLAKVATVGGQPMWGSVPGQKGDYALTIWSTISKGDRSALLLCHPITGRTHQLRVHLSEMGHPILGDPIYGKKAIHPYFAARSFLHAHVIEFPHPVTGKLLKIEAPVPSDFKTAMQELQLCRS